MDSDAVLAVTGAHFVPRVKVDFDSPGSSAVSSSFSLTLSSGAGRVPLTGVTLVSGERLEATLTAGAAEPGVYDVEVVDPRGRRSVLPSALTVYATTCTRDGDPCDDGDLCTSGDTCQAGMCGVPSPACSNTAPFACLTVSPTGGLVGSQFTADAGCSEDTEDAAAGIPLQYRFTLDGTTIEEGSSSTASYTVSSSGRHTVTVEVIDSDGLSAFADRYIVAVAAGEEVVVTTGVDEEDAETDPSNPMGTGLSLREAVNYVNTLAAARTILFSSGLSGPITMTKALPALTVSNTAIVGRPDLSLDFSSISGNCITLSAAGQRLVGLTIVNFAGVGISLSSASSESQVAECSLSGLPTAYGIVAEGAGRIGPRNDLSQFATAVRLTSPGYVVGENRIHDNTAGIFLADGASATVQQNLVYANSSYGLQAGGSGTCLLRFNVFDNNGGNGVSGGEMSLQANNNLMTRNGGYGLTGMSFTSLSHNGFFSNSLGDLSGASLGDTDVLDDPLYAGADAGDYRLLRRSPCIDAGLDIGLDVNDLAPGLYNGQAPDLGAHETPYAGRLP